jgi:hypothetical protein
MEPNRIREREPVNESGAEGILVVDRRPYATPRLTAHGNLSTLICAAPGGKGVAVFAGYGRTF